MYLVSRGTDDYFSAAGLEGPKAESREAAFQRIRFLRTSSAPLSPSLHREFLDKFKLLLIQAMGSSEAGNVFSNPLAPGENKIGSPGLPWGFETKIVDREGAELAAGEPGEILLRGAGMMQGYYKDPEERRRCSTPTAGCTRATSPIGTRTDTSSSSADPRN